MWIDTSNAKNMNVVIKTDGTNTTWAIVKDHPKDNINTDNTLKSKLKDIR